MTCFRLDWGRNIEAARRAAGWSQADLAGRCGKTQQAISRWEKGIRMPRDEDRLRVAKELGVTVEELFPWPTGCDDGEAA